MTGVQRAIARQWLRLAVREATEPDGDALAAQAARSMGLGPDDWSELAEMAGLLCEHEQARRGREEVSSGA